MKERVRKWKSEKCEELSSSDELDQTIKEPRKDYDNPEVADEKLNEVKGIIRDLMDFSAFRDIDYNMFTKEEENFYVPVQLGSFNYHKFINVQDVEQATMEDLAQ
jgi:hypothetical protein